MTQEEKQIIEEAKKNPEKFSVLYETYFDSVYRYVARRVGIKEDIEEIVSQTFFDALDNIKKFEWRGFPFSSWLFKIAHNNVAGWYRKNKDKKHISIENIFGLHDKDADVRVSYEKNEAANCVKDLLKELDMEEREILRLKYFEDLTNIDIAYIFNISPNALGVKLYRILKKSQKIIFNY